MSDGKTPPEQGADHDDRKEDSDSIDLKPRRRDVMKVAGAAGVIGSGFTGVASAQDCPSCADPEQPGPDLCRNCDQLDADCEFVTKENGPLNGDGCYIGPIPDNATDAVIKAGQECIYVEDLTTPMCVPDDCPGFSHIEFYDCPVPKVTGLSADCSTLTIETEDAVGDTISVDYRLQLVDDEGNARDVVDNDGVSVTDDNGDGDYTIDVSGATDDPWNRAAFDAVVHSDGTDMLAEGGFDSPTFRDTPELCNPPAVNNLAVDCGGQLTITTENVPEGDTLLVDYTLEELDADGNSVDEPGEGTDVMTTVDADGDATVDLTEGGGTIGWNVVDVSSVVHDASDAEMLAPRPQREIVTV